MIPIRFVLPLFSLFALYAVFLLSYRNGFLLLLQSVIANKTLPGSDGLLRTRYTGLGPLDHVLENLNPFFWPAISGSSPSMSLFFLEFIGTYGAAWTLIALEGWRDGNTGNAVAFPSVFGILAQLLTYAFTVPIYCTWHLYTSRTASRPSSRHIRVPLAVARLLPLTVTIGYILPSVAMCLPAPSFLTTETKQLLLGIWQPFPIYVSILTTVCTLLFPTRPRDGLEPMIAARSGLRYTYAFAFASAAIPRTSAWTLSLVSLLSPGLYADNIARELHPLRVFATISPWSSPGQVSSVGEGALWFLQWDSLIGSTALLVWTAVLYLTAHRGIFIEVSWMEMVSKTVLLWMVSGPVGAAVALIWERDEVIFERFLRLGYDDGLKIKT